MAELSAKVQQQAQQREAEVAAAGSRLRAIEGSAAELRSAVTALTRDLQVTVVVPV